MPPTEHCRAIVVQNEALGRGYFGIVLRAPDVARAAQPGRFVMLRVSENLDPFLARPFGIASLPSRASIELIYRIVGRGTALLSRVTPGTGLGLLGPIGNGFPAPERGETPVLVAGGSGFPPLSFFALRSRERPCFLIGAANRSCLPPIPVLKRLRAKADSVRLATDDGSAGKEGTAADLLTDFLGRPGRDLRPVVYACGPHGMLGAVSRIAEEHGVPCYVSLEERMACGLGACMGCSIPMRAGGYKRACTEGPVFDARVVDWREQVFLRMHREPGGKS